MKKLLLSVKRGKFRRDDSQVVKADREFDAKRERAVIRDDYTCRFCGFKALKHQEVHHADDDHANNSMENLDTVDVLCHAVNHVGFAGLGGNAVMVYLPGVQQVDLNHFMRTIFVALRTGDDEEQKCASGMLEQLTGLQDRFSSTWGTSSPVVIGNELRLMPEARYRRRDKILAAAKLVFRRSFVKESVLDYWCASVYKGLDPGSWKLIYSGFFD